MQKLKYQYQKTEKRQRTKCIWVVDPHIRNSVFRHFSTKQEKSFYFLHLIECKDYPLKLRVARGKGLAVLGMTYRHLFMQSQKAGNTIPKESSNTIKSRNENKRWEFYSHLLFCISSKPDLTVNYFYCIRQINRL